MVTFLGLMDSKWKEFYTNFLFDINWLRYEEKMNMQTIIKIVPTLINHCLKALPETTVVDESRELYKNMISLSGSRYKLNQFIENLSTYIPAGKVFKLN